MFSVDQRSNVGKNLASLPLVAVRICWVQAMFAHDMDKSRVGHLRIWRLSARSIASDIAEALPSLRVIAIGDGVNVYNDALARHRFCGAEIWWCIVPEESLLSSSQARAGQDDEPDTAEDEYGERSGNGHSRNCPDSIEIGEESGETSDSDLEGGSGLGGSQQGSSELDSKSTDKDDERSNSGTNDDEESQSASDDDDAGSYRLDDGALHCTLGPNKSRRMLPISRDFGEHIREYLESERFTESSPFDGERCDPFAKTFYDH